MKRKYIFLLLTIILALSNNKTSAQTVYLSGSNQPIEGNNYTFQAHITALSPTPVVLNISTASATADVFDYVPLTTTITIPAGQLSSPIISIATIDDSIAESYEYFTVNVSVTSGNTTNLTMSMNASIGDNDTVPSIWMSTYGGGIEGFNIGASIYLSNPFNAPITIALVSVDETADVSDYTPVTTTITIPAGQTGASITISTTNDAIAETDETFRLNATVTSGNTTNGTLSYTLKIIDNDTVPTLKFTHDTITEGETVQYYTSLSNPYHSDIVIQFTATAGTAGTSDFTSAVISTTILANTYSNSQIISAFTAIDDTDDEPLEVFNVTATSPDIAAPVVRTVTIVDNDGLPDLMIQPVFSATISEGTPAKFMLYLPHPSPTPTVIQVTTISGTAGTSDYTPLNTTVTIPANHQTMGDIYVTIPTILDQLQETDETFTVSAVVTSGNTFNTTASITATIVDDYNIHAYWDSVESVADIGGTFSLLTNDTLHGLPLNATDAIIAFSPNSNGITVDALGMLHVPASLPIGYYQLSYTVCEITNPTICDTQSVMIIVKSPLSASYDVVYSDANGDGYTSAGDLITYQITVTNLGNTPITNIDYDMVFGITPLGGPVAILNAGQSDSTTFYATHILTQNDINFGFSGQQLEVSFVGTYNGYEVTGFANYNGTFQLQQSDGIRLNAFVDGNANGVQDAGELNFPLGQFNYEISNDGNVHHLLTSPFYLYESNPTTVYNLSYTVDAAYASNNTCTTSYTGITVASGSGITTYNFPVTVTPYQEVDVNLISYLNAARVGGYHNIYVKYTNNSNQPVASGTITFVKDPVLTLDHTTPASTATASGFTYNYTNLLPYETRYIAVTLVVPPIPAVSLGQFITQTVSITPAGDLIPSNNTSVLSEPLVGSFDPNEKTESHGGRVLHSGFTADDYLTYTIHFENTGTASAINIRVEDVLDSKLEPSSVKMIDASAGYSLERIDNRLIWKFSGIDLPPSIADTEIGKGYVVFQVKPKPGFALGDVIPNTADIYFDSNPAIITEVCNTEFVSTLRNPDFTFHHLRHHPNPVNHILHIDNDSVMDTVTITSISGQKILEKSINGVQSEIDLSAIANGVYFAKITSKNQEKTIKIIKQ